MILTGYLGFVWKIKFINYKTISYIQERTQQAAFAVADNALYQNPFFLQRSDHLRIGRVGFPLNCHNCQGALAASVVENHDAPFSAEIGGEVHGCL